MTKKDLRIDYFKVSGAGGQHRDKTDAGCRITHVASGAVGQASDSRSQADNRKAAFLKMANSEAFKKWHKIEVSRLMGMEAEIERNVESAMKPKNIKIEVKDERGKWRPADESELVGDGTSA